MNEEEIILALPKVFKAVPEAPAAKATLGQRLFGKALADGQRTQRTTDDSRVAGEKQTSRYRRKELIMPKKNSQAMGEPMPPIMTDDELLMVAGGTGETMEGDYKAQAEADGRSYYSHDRHCNTCGKMAVYYKSSVKGLRGPTYLETKCYACGDERAEMKAELQKAFI